MLLLNQPILEAGVKTVLSDLQQLIFYNPVETLAEVITQSPDILITDHLVNFQALEEFLLHHNNQPDVLILSADNTVPMVSRLVQAGIKGFVTPHSSKEELLLALQAIARGEKYFTGKILNIILKQHNARKSEEASLTIREKEVLVCLAKGLSTKSIAEALHLSPHTVQTHRKSIIKKLGIKSPTQFVIAALDLGLFKP
jgi:two-component system, NarL family, invasion response regulator UvrY